MIKKWMYVIFPGTGLILFLFLYFAEVKKMDEKEAAHNAEVAQLKKADEDRKARLQQEAAESQVKKAKERADELARKEADKAAKWKAEGDKIQEETDKFLAEATDSSKKITELEAQLKALRDQREKANDEYIDLELSVEKAKIDRRSAEIEIQRTTQMVASRAEKSSLTAMPAPVIPPAAH
jgi:colicin import membrane protein